MVGGTIKPPRASVPRPYGGSSYIDDVTIRQRDTNANGSLDERFYFVQNWRHDVVAIINSDGQVQERITYDAYGRPHCFSPGDLKTNAGADRPDGSLNVNDSWTTGSVLWNKDIGNSSGLAIPDGTVDANDGTTLTNLKAAGFSGGYGLLSSSAVGNRRGFAGYEFDPILEGSASADNKPVYHVRHRVLACDTGKWFQKDPLGYHDSMDLYEYCGSDPASKVDPTGLTACDWECIEKMPVLTEPARPNLRADYRTTASYKSPETVPGEWLYGIDFIRLIWERVTTRPFPAQFPVVTAEIGVVANNSFLSINTDALWMLGAKNLSLATTWNIKCTKEVSNGIRTWRISRRSHDNSHIGIEPLEITHLVDGPIDAENAFTLAVSVQVNSARFDWITANVGTVAGVSRTVSIPATSGRREMGTYRWNCCCTTWRNRCDPTRVVYANPLDFGGEDRTSPPK